MPGINEDRDRRVVPLWRSFDATTRLGELAPLAAPSPNRFSDGMLSEVLDDWKDHRSISIASDLVSSAFTLGRFKVATDPAEFILSMKSASPAARSIANIYLSGSKPQTDCTKDMGSPPSFTRGDVPDIGSLQLQMYGGIREARIQLGKYPRNPILWSNLARFYTSLGLQSKAEKAILTALAMAPENRFVLRAASRFFLHQGQKERAHSLLTNAAGTKFDPWLLAAEIAIADASRKTSKFIKTGRRLLALEKHSPFHLSELASALGTIESVAGNLKRGKTLLHLSLQQPAENATAQAAWVSRRIDVGLVAGTKSTNSFEANAWLAWKASQWDSALLEAKRWQADQPFSSRPAMFGSHLASSVIENYELAIAFAKQGFLSNPDDFSLNNNLAFSLAMHGDLAESLKVLRRINTSQLGESERIVFEATMGLVAFRSYDVDKGRALYKSAVSRAKRLGDKREHTARIYWAFEELRRNSDDAEVIRQQAINESTVLTDPTEIVLIERLKQYKPDPSHLVRTNSVRQKV
jgi:tetratricopeptide (TPR) repeat protein